MRWLGLYIPALLFTAALVAVVLFPAPIEYLKGQVQGMDSLSYLVFVLLLVAATVFMPVTVMPLIPMAAATTTKNFPMAISIFHFVNPKFLVITHKVTQHHSTQQPQPHAFSGPPTAPSQ